MKKPTASKNISIAACAGFFASQKLLSGGAPVPEPITTTFTVAEAAFGLFGYHDSITNAAQRRWQNLTHTWTAWVTGTDARLISLQNGQAGSISIDGGAEVAVTAALGYVQLFTGLADVPHLVQARGYFYTNVSGDFIEVTGAVPAIGQGDDLGPAYFSNESDTYAQSSYMMGAMPSANVRPQLRYPSASIVAGYARQGATVIRAQCECIWLFMGGPGCWLSVDGGRPVKTSFVKTFSTAATWRKVASGLDNTATHTYLIIPELNTGLAPHGVMIGGYGASFSALPTIKRVVQFGDSITRGENRSNVPNAAVDTYEYCAANGWLPHAVGYTGKTTAQITADLPSLMAALQRLPDYAVSAIGHNNVTGATFVEDYMAWITALSSYGFGKIACRIIVPNNTSLANDLAQNVDIQTAITAVGDVSIVRFGDDTTWLHIATVEGDGGVDGANPDVQGLHPDNSGYHTLAGYETPVLASIFAWQ